MTPKQAAKYLGVSVSHTRALCRSGKLKHTVVELFPEEKRRGIQYMYDISEEAIRVFITQTSTETRGRPRVRKPVRIP